jgi:hypothetical protein
MKLYEFFIDKISETAIFEMARSRKDAKDTITSLSPQIVHHLIKVFAFNDPQNQNHWLGEINTWLNQIDDIYLKPSNKKPDWQTLYNWIVFDSSPHYSPNYIDLRIKKWMAGEYKNTKLQDYSSEFVLNSILSILEKVVKDISNDRFVSIRDYI